MAGTTPLFAAIRRLSEYRATHPDVIITYPSESRSRLWEVSLPGASAMGFDTLERMIGVLEDLDAATPAGAEAEQ